MAITGSVALAAEVKPVYPKKRKPKKKAAAKGKKTKKRG